MRSAETLREASSAYRNARVENRHGDLLRRISKDLEEDAMLSNPKGYVEFQIGAQQVALASRDGGSVELLDYLSGLGYRISIGAEDPRDRTVRIFCYWK